MLGVHFMILAGLHFPLRLVRFISLALCFALLFSAMPVSLKHGNPSAQGSGKGGQKRTTPPYYKLPNLNNLINEGKKLKRPALPRPPLKPSTICGYRDKACKVKLGKAKKVGQNFVPSNDNAGQKSVSTTRKNNGNWFHALGRAFSNAFFGSSGLTAKSSSFLAADSNRVAGNKENFNTGAAANLPTPPNFSSLSRPKIELLLRYNRADAGAVSSLTVPYMRSKAWIKKWINRTWRNKSASKVRRPRRATCV